jgi:hypothetical protein
MEILRKYQRVLHSQREHLVVLELPVEIADDAAVRRRDLRDLITPIAGQYEESMARSRC